MWGVEKGKETERGKEGACEWEKNICSREGPTRRTEPGSWEYFFVGSLSKEEGEGVGKKERKSLRDGEVLSLLDSNGKLLLVGGLAHVESMDVKGKGWGERKRKKEEKKKHKPRPVLFTSTRKRTKHYHSHIAHFARTSFSMGCRKLDWK